MAAQFFYDSYAVLAFTSGNQAYKPYFTEHNGVLTKLNLLEIYSRCLVEYNAKVATSIAEAFSKYVIDFGLRDIAGAMNLRLNLKRKGRDISYADAVGYYLSAKLGAKFLTGDQAFRDLTGVEFVE